MADKLTTLLYEHLGSKKTFTKQELETILKNYYDKPHPDTTFRWRIHDLKARGVIRNIARSIYAFPQVNKEFEPGITPEANKIYEQIHQSMPFTTIALIDTAWFNEFMVHQIFKTYIIIEVEKDATSSVFNNLLMEYKESYLNPGREIFHNYIINGDQPVIINSMISESPLIQVNSIKIASLEKLLVDMVSNDLLYAGQQEEMAGIFEVATKKYFVNMNKLKRYAKRRNRTKQIEELINKTSV